MPAPAAKEARPKAAAPKADEPKSTEKDEPAKKDAAAKKEKDDPKKGGAKDDPKKDTAKDDPKKDASAKKDAAAKKEETAKKAAKPEPKAPSRIWVQIAGGADRAALPREYARMKEKAPKLLAARSAWTTPLRFTNRLLVGPFKSEEEAQDLVNELNKQGFSAFTWTSPAGQEIEKLAVK